MHKERLRRKFLEFPLSGLDRRHAFHGFIRMDFPFAILKYLGIVSLVHFESPNLVVVVF